MSRIALSSSTIRMRSSDVVLVSGVPGAAQYRAPGLRRLQVRGTRKRDSGRRRRSALSRPASLVRFKRRDTTVSIRQVEE
jgi:hypothetical protein